MKRLWRDLTLFTMSLALYVRTLAPTITWQHDGYDAGDLITAAFSLGIPHPTGYPTYMLLGNLFTRLPWGDTAYRMNLLSALSAALTVSLVYRASMTMLHSKPYATLSSACAALLLATSRIFWSQALITEVYALNCLFFALVAYLLLRLQTHMLEWSSPQVYRTLALMALIYGLSLGNHLTMAFCAPLLLFQAAFVFSQHTLRTRQWAGILGSLLLGLSVYAYLPLRAGIQPLINWGNPSTVRGLLWLMGGGIYRQYVMALPWVHWGTRIMTWAGLLREQFGILGAILGLLGAWRHSERSPWRFAGFLMTFAIYSIYAIGYNVTDSYVYLLPVYLIYTLWIARGIQYLLRALTLGCEEWSRPKTALPYTALLILPLVSLYVNWGHVDLSGDYTAYDYGSEVFAQVPDRSIIITATDGHTFTLWYFGRVVTDRDQVAVLDRDLLGYDWYVQGIRQSYPWLRLPQNTPSSDVNLDDLLRANSQSAAIFLSDRDAELMARYTFRTQGLLYRLASD